MRLKGKKWKDHVDLDEVTLKDVLLHGPLIEIRLKT